MSQTFNARHLNVAAFTQAKVAISGEELLPNYERLAQELQASAPDLTLKWQATGESRTAVDGSVRPAIHLQVQANVPLTCQRCMEAVHTPIDVDRHFIFVPDEATAAAMDDDSEDDVLEMSTDFNLLGLIEDEVLMALPLVPRHDVCPTGVIQSAQTDDFNDVAEEKPNPFAALAALKGQKP